MNFREAVIQTPQLGTDAYRPGKQALGKHSDRVVCRSGEEGRRFTGSVNLDEALRDAYPDAPRWDYGLGIRAGQSSEAVVWIEVHPAYTSEVSAVLAKLEWLKNWLHGSAPLLRELTCRNPGRVYFWLASGGVHIPKTSPQARRLSQAGVEFPREVIEL